MGGGGTILAWSHMIPITISPRVWYFKINSGRFLDYKQSPPPPPRSLSRELKKERRDLQLIEYEQKWSVSGISI